MRKINIVMVALALYVFIGYDAYAEESRDVKMLPPIIAQTYGPGNTIIMWHDTDDDGEADFKATYIFVDGRLHLINKISQKKAIPRAL
jgi:hypothetical protein